MNLSSIPEYKLTSKDSGELQFKLELLSTSSGYNPIKPHRHNYYEIFLFEEGGGIHMIDFDELTIKREHIHILSPGQIHFMNRDTKSHGLVIKFTPDFFTSNVDVKHILNRIPFLKNKISSPIVIPDSNEFKSILELANHIKLEFENKRTGYQDMIRNYLNLILLKCDRLYDYNTSKQTNENNNLNNQFKSLLEESFLNENRVSFYSEKLNISTDKLNQVLKQENNKTAGEMITDILLLESKRLLLHSEKSIKEVAYHLNFQDNAYFNRWFKKLEECSPGAFRTLNREKYNL